MTADLSYGGREQKGEDNKWDGKKKKTVRAVVDRKRFIVDGNVHTNKQAR